MNKLKLKVKYINLKYDIIECYVEVKYAILMVFTKDFWFWKMMGFAKRTGGWDIWLGKKMNLDYDIFPKPHWDLHPAKPLGIKYRDEY